MTALENGRANSGAAAALNVAIIQMNSQDDKQANIAAALDLIDRAAATGARLVALPEVWPYLGPDDVSRDQAETIPGPITELLAQRAPSWDLHSRRQHLRDATGRPRDVQHHRCHRSHG